MLVDRQPPPLPDLYPYEGLCDIRPIGRIVHQLWEEVHGVRQPGMCWMHLCEHHDEVNRCANVEHVRLATRSENEQHKHALRRAAGVPHHLAGRLSRPPLSAEARERIASSKRGRPRSADTIAKMRAGALANPVWERRELCPHCGRCYNPQWMTRHVKEGRCHVPA